LEAGSYLDRFRLDRLIGTGAFGQVWLAIDEGSHGFRKRVALKILARTTNQKRIDALFREARICGSLNHPNIVDVYGVMQTDEAAFIIMEFVEGEALSALWKDLEFLGVRFPRSIILDIGISVCEALYHGWTSVDDDGNQLKIVHRDLKPANVMISDRGSVLVCDFGIAKVPTDVETTRTGKLKGTPSYLAPELWQGKRDFRPAIDLWSLGVILWEMTVGKRFFGRAGMAEIFDLVATRSPATEARALTSYFPELVPLVEKLLQRDADDRYQSALEVADLLRGIRNQIGASGDLLQFSRLVRAGRLEPEDRQGSLIALPALPLGALDWEPLVNVASGDGGAPPSNAPWDTGSHALKIGPGEDDPHRAGPNELTNSGQQEPVVWEPVSSRSDLDITDPFKVVDRGGPASEVEAPTQRHPGTDRAGEHMLPHPTLRTGDTCPAQITSKLDLTPLSKADDDDEPLPTFSGPPWGAIAIAAAAAAAAAVLIFKVMQ
jgi:serine/threonine protein kinase